MKTGPAELFIPLAQIEEVAAQTLQATGRIDANAIVQPIEVSRRLNDPAAVSGARLDSTWRNDIFVPREVDKKYASEEIIDGKHVSVKNRLRYDSFESALYARLTGRYMLTLSAEEHERLAYEQEGFAQAIEDSSYDAKRTHSQLHDAYILRSGENTPADIAKTRLYIPGGLNGVGIVRSLIEKNVAFAGAKIRVPDTGSKPQIFRQDTPIVLVDSKEQLRETVAALREIMPELTPQNTQPMVGHSIEGLPGTYLGQYASGTSFNGVMQRLLGGAVYEASQHIKLQAGEKVTAGILEELAVNARQHAQRVAESYGVNPDGHAFVVGQNAHEMRELLINI